MDYVKRTRRKKTNLTKHHRLPRSAKGDSSRRNISMVPLNSHRSWHQLFSNYSPEVICRIISNIYIDPDYYVVAILKEKKCQ